MSAARLEGVLAAARREGRAALIGYLPAGFPTVDGAVRALTTLAEGGCDILEVGLPYTDPVLDGPVNQDANAVALANGVRTADVLGTVARLTRATSAPVLVMTYWNPVYQYGPERFATELAAAGGSGCLLLDLPVQHAPQWTDAAERHGLASVFLVAPTSTGPRLARVAAASTGFVYAASSLGVTGMRQSVGERAAGLVARIREVTGLPVCVGLGVSDGAQAAEIAAFADGVIVGSAFVRRLLDAPGEDTGLAGIAALAKELAAGVRRRPENSSPKFGTREGAAGKEG
ncbi:tryptophan synthase subunit alpha [Amycolatopsis cynarae]|uniref:Tryptophan synthase alpha chain n=1 Tax=Amycolatopsis cynarae TaxID=2995223 RepID=A0ABY7AX82_9PSEU|nr:tryptophan synthase subunit alpha [Amycolatopsis sp. HUAS 11-8]WAL64624.1 tryptophan synthase subunit alpha [Amycolatopsis sp. HUAS 11-8]